jgi:hypothetical protein
MFTSIHTWANEQDTLVVCINMSKGCEIGLSIDTPKYYFDLVTPLQLQVDGN